MNVKELELSSFVLSAYEAPHVEIIIFSATDVITTSDTDAGVEFPQESTWG